MAYTISYDSNIFVNCSPRHYKADMSGGILKNGDVVYSAAFHIIADDGYEFPDGVNYVFTITKGMDYKDIPLLRHDAPYDKTVLINTRGVATGWNIEFLDEIKAVEGSPPEPLPDVGKVYFEDSAFKNATVNYSNNDDYVSSKKIRITPNDGFEFPAYYNSDGEMFMTLHNPYTDDSVKVYLTYDVFNGYWEYNKSLPNDVNIILNDEYFAFNRWINISGNVAFTNCSINYDNHTVYDDSKPIEIIADDGYVFSDEIEYPIKFDYGTFYFTNMGYKLVYSDVILDTFEIGIESSFVAVVKPVERPVPYLNLYSADNRVIKALNEFRFSMADVDYGQYIINLYILPIPIDSDLKTDVENIKLGGRDTEIPATIINEYLYRINLGSIKVSEKFNNVYDYINTSFTLYVPWFDRINLSSEQVMGCSLSLDLVIDLYHGVATLNVVSSFSDSVVFTRNISIGYNIPIMQTNNAGILGTLSNFSVMNIKQAYVEVVRNIPYTTNKVIGSTIEYGVIGNYNDFIRCDNIELISMATNDEKEEIIKLLKEGVII